MCSGNDLGLQIRHRRDERLKLFLRYDLVFVANDGEGRHLVVFQALFTHMQVVHPDTDRRQRIKVVTR